jgi:hypothetical protein
MAYLVKNISGRIQSMPKKLGSLSLDANNWQIGETDYVEDGAITYYQNHPDVFQLLPTPQEVAAVGDFPAGVAPSRPQNIVFIGPSITDYGKWTVVSGSKQGFPALSEFAWAQQFLGPLVMP